MNSLTTTPLIEAFFKHAAPLLPLSTVQTLKRIRRVAAMELVDQGAIAFAFNIGRRSSVDQEVRVFKDSLVLHLQSPADRLDFHLPDTNYEIEPILAACLPDLRKRPASFVTVTGADLQRLWSCGPDLIADLIRDGELFQCGLAGPKQSPVVTYMSAFNFLQRRRIGAQPISSNLNSEI